MTLNKKSRDFLYECLKISQEKNLKRWEVNFWSKIVTDYFINLFNKIFNFLMIKKDRFILNILKVY